MTINLNAPLMTELKPRIVVIGVGGAGGNAVNNMISSGLDGVEFIVANTDSQALAQSQADRRIQLGAGITQGLGCGAQPDVGRAARSHDRNSYGLHHSRNGRWNGYWWCSGHSRGIA